MTTDPNFALNKPYPWGHTNACEAQVLAVLQSWFEGIEEGRALLWQPDPRFKRRNGKPPWSEEDVDRIITAIDEEFEKEAMSWAKNSTAIMATAGPGFSRLGPAQRRALCEELDMTLAKYPFKEVPGVGDVGQD